MVLTKNNDSHKNWTRLDNVAKVFPSTIEKSDTRVFRFCCELEEEIDAAVLQGAVDDALLDFPHFRCIMRNGLFWYYLEQTSLSPIVFEENKPPCGPIYNSGSRELLFEVSYFGRRINLEIFHSLADGTGTLSFLQNIVMHYLFEKHSGDFGEMLPFLDDNASAAERAVDEYRKYYQKNGERVKKDEIKRAFVCKGELREDDTILVIEGAVSASKVLELAHSHSCTLTTFIAALYFQAIEKEMSVDARRLPVVIGIPVNLRKFFPSETARNFFTTVSIEYNFSKQPDTLDGIIAEINRVFTEKLTKEYLSCEIFNYTRLEHNAAIKLAPLPFKDFVMRSARHAADRKCTSMISNIGRITMPERLSGYIRQFCVYTSTKSIQVCTCSFGDRLTISFSSAFNSTEIQKNFFRSLTELDLEVEISSNDFNRAAQ